MNHQGKKVEVSRPIISSSTPRTHMKPEWLFNFSSDDFISSEQKIENSAVTSNFSDSSFAIIGLGPSTDSSTINSELRTQMETSLNFGESECSERSGEYWNSSKYVTSRSATSSSQNTYNSTSLKGIDFGSSTKSINDNGSASSPSKILSSGTGILQESLTNSSKKDVSLKRRMEDSDEISEYFSAKKLKPDNDSLTDASNISIKLEDQRNYIFNEYSTELSTTDHDISAAAKENVIATGLSDASSPTEQNSTQLLDTSNMSLSLSCSESEKASNKLSEEHRSNPTENVVDTFNSQDDTCSKLKSLRNKSARSRIARGLYLDTLKNKVMSLMSYRKVQSSSSDQKSNDNSNDLSSSFNSSLAVNVSCSSNEQSDKFSDATDTKMCYSMEDNNLKPMVNGRGNAENEQSINNKTSDWKESSSKRNTVVTDLKDISLPLSQKSSNNSDTLYIKDEQNESYTTENNSRMSKAQYGSIQENVKLETFDSSFEEKNQIYTECTKTFVEVAETYTGKEENIADQDTLKVERESNDEKFSEISEILNEVIQNMETENDKDETNLNLHIVKTKPIVNLTVDRSMNTSNFYDLFTMLSIQTSKIPPTSTIDVSASSKTTFADILNKTPLDSSYETEDSDSSTNESKYKALINFVNAKKKISKGIILSLSKARKGLSFIQIVNHLKEEIRPTLGPKLQQNVHNFLETARILGFIKLKSKKYSMSQDFQNPNMKPNKSSRKQKEDTFDCTNAREKTVFQNLFSPFGATKTLGRRRKKFLITTPKRCPPTPKAVTVFKTLRSRKVIVKV